MCIGTETVYADCSCMIPDFECCPRCPEGSCTMCKDFQMEIEMKDGVCVGLGPCPFFRCRDCSYEEDGNSDEDIGHREVTRYN